MAISPTPRGPGPSGNSLAAIVKAAVGDSIAAILTSWGKMPAVRTFQEYLGRKLPVLTCFGVGGLLVGGKVGTTLALGALVSLVVDTGLAAWHQLRSGAAPSQPRLPEAPAPGAPPKIGGAPDARRRSRRKSGVRRHAAGRRPRRFR